MSVQYFFSQCSYFLRHLGFQDLCSSKLNELIAGADLSCKAGYSRVVKKFSTGCLSKVSLPFTAGYRSACQPSQEWISLRG